MKSKDFIEAGTLGLYYFQKSAEEMVSKIGYNITVSGFSLGTNLEVLEIQGKVYPGEGLSRDSWVPHLVIKTEDGWLENWWTLSREEAESESKKAKQSKLKKLKQQVLLLISEVEKLEQELKE